MKDQCPKCDSQEIYISQDGGGVGSGLSLFVLSDHAMRPTHDWVTHLCSTCGYFENFVLNKEFIEVIVNAPEKNGWKKVNS